MERRRTTTPPSDLFALFTPTNKNPKSATYIWKNLQLNPRNPQTFGNSIKVTVTINNLAIDLLNVYSPGRSLHIAKEIQQYRPLPNAYIAGDFNAHHTWWYSNQAIVGSNNIRNHSLNSNTIAQWMTREGMTLSNIPGTHTFFRGTSRTVIDLTFYRGICDNLKQSWNIDMEDHGSYHLPTSTVWNIKKPTFTPTQAWHKADWNAIHSMLKHPKIPTLATSYK